MFRSLKSKISFVYFCLVLIIAVVGIAALVNLYQLNRSIDGLMSANYKSISFVNAMLEANERQDSAIHVYINIDRQKGIDIYTENDNVFRSQLNAENHNITESGEQELADKVASEYSHYEKDFFRLQEIRNSEGIQSANQLYNMEIMPEFLKLKQDLKSILQLNEKAMFNGKTKATHRSRQSMLIILILTTIAAAGGFFTSRFFTNRFLRPMDELIGSIKLIKAGQLDQQAHVISDDEIGEMASEFNNMTKRLLQFEKSAVGSLMSEKNRFIAVVKNISDPLVVLDKSYKIGILNKACESFFDIAEEKALNRHFLEVIRNGELFDHISGEFVPGEERREKILHFNSNDGEFYLNVVVTMVKDVGNHLTGLIVLFQNVTALKELEKIRTDFISTISHEYKTPLTSIMMGTDLLLNEGIGVLTEDQTSITTAIKEDCERLNTLVNEVMELTRLESGKAVFKIEPCSIVGIIDSTYRQFKQIAEKKSIDLEFDAEEDLPLVSADREKITWVLNNLVSNALKYTNAGDDILISANVHENKMHVSVKDTGVGIPDEYKEHIFEKFFQVKGNDLEIRGTGLGLSVAKEIIQAHNGKIWCESKLDLGSKFTFTLNLSK